MYLPQITPKQQEILLLISRHRFLNRIQIQAFLNHRYPKRINDWLKDLTQKQYLGRIYSKTFGENTKPALYYVGIQGVRYLREYTELPEELLRKFYRDKDRSDSFIAQCVLLADICRTLGDKNEHGGPSFEALLTSEFTREGSPYNFLGELRPDLFIRSMKGKKSTRKQYLLEVFEETLPRYSIRKRLNAYKDFYFEGEWEENTDAPFPVILLICSTKALMIYTKRLMKRILEDEDNPEDLHVWVITRSTVKEFGFRGTNWEVVW